MKETLGRVAISILEGVARSLGHYVTDKAIDKWESRRAGLGPSPAACCKCGRERVCPVCGDGERLAR